MSILLMSSFTRGSFISCRRPVHALVNRKHERFMASVTGTIYEVLNDDGDKDSSAISVTLFTKEGCTLCDKVKDVLVEVKEDEPHSLHAIDITDDEHVEWFNRYKYDIPVLHINGEYWIKHRLTKEEALEGFQSSRNGKFVSPKGEPDAAKMER
eukprot:CAMPEP_0116060052 /NCGR_PEP_ID=MMETSP0322-20121206/6174_1 /TAXON_ID=163516 /ORGANISM="Leptocylindrus danicus var. apora, Strain B651" /LENGTH=153 /DNA_ID=CAMNT_0003544575 /DNA_START=198 /DNA_END=659 /DNA_ORIENTATION=-